MKTTLAVLCLFLASSTALAQESKKVDQAWLAKVAELKPVEQAKTTADKLQELNFKLPASVHFVAEDGKLVHFSFNGSGPSSDVNGSLTAISPQ